MEFVLLVILTQVDASGCIKNAFVCAYIFMKLTGLKACGGAKHRWEDNNRTYLREAGAEYVY
jgi:hypothetical protein